MCVCVCVCVCLKNIIWARCIRLRIHTIIKLIVTLEEFNIVCSGEGSEGMFGGKGGGGRETI